MRLTQKGTANDIVSAIEPIIIGLLRRIQANKCSDCGKELKEYQICHKRYGEDITIYDLALKCGSCHALEHNIKAPRGTLRHYTSLNLN